MCDRSMIRAVMLVATLLSTSGAHAQGSAGTGSTSTGIGEPTGPAGPGIRSKGWTQQPGVATNSGTTNNNLSPAEKNSIPPPNAPQFQRNLKGYQK
jgi:hypothetical protein